MAIFLFNILVLFCFLNAYSAKNNNDTYLKNCLIQLDYQHCDECLQNYHLTDDEECEPEHCDEYDEKSGFCQKCYSGYKVDQFGACVTTLSKTLILVLSLGIAIGLTLIIGITIILCKRHHRQRRNPEIITPRGQQIQNFNNLPVINVLNPLRLRPLPRSIPIQDRSQGQPYIPYSQNTELQLPQPIQAQIPSNLCPNNENLYRSRDICTICLASKTNIRTSCSHQFHIPCIIQWCKRKYACPDCNNLKFRLTTICVLCREFKNNVNICLSSCKETNHMNCFNKLNKSKCRDCQQFRR